MSAPGGPASLKFKLIFVGEQTVGKSALITRFVYDTFEDNYAATVGMDLLSKTIYVSDKPVRLQLWDTAGQERFRALIPSYFRDASVGVVCFDVTSRTSFNKVDSWVAEVRKERGSSVVVTVCGNKIDLDDKRQVTEEEATNKVADLTSDPEAPVMYFETSAKTGAGVKEMFKHIAARLVSAGAEEQEQHGETLQKTGEEIAGKKTCSC
ncbi:unnamed protein product [Vitrella brassicaformis CCMP3155]|uniref:Uncharacterized protein n=2 Tax=Vitrella brassicaformis TaxID=1169539 RepID=A0A0G4EUD6_VITBC|nr:unnamed protein product [Vitrella brassicaformis CCMP3155]|mmetsp:Transcript_39007/g.97633  ORF Transcript_39007/g.97633 Transcript_39007/m.97633 type:complete len:209 (+) Transcript_39007:134-760(+)|eukprot:CEM02264.1 unnamed protein product [Vitrella brassicaformis CCMP3155]